MPKRGQSPVSEAPHSALVPKTAEKKKRVEGAAENPTPVTQEPPKQKDRSASKALEESRHRLSPRFFSLPSFAHTPSPKDKDQDPFDRSQVKQNRYAYRPADIYLPTYEGEFVKVEAAELDPPNWPGFEDEGSEFPWPLTTRPERMCLKRNVKGELFVPNAPVEHGETWIAAMGWTGL